MSTMNVETYIQSLESLLAEAWSLPLSRGKALVDVEQVRTILEKLVDALPSEISQAKAIVADRTQIISDAKAEADNIVKNAQKKAEIILSKEEIVRQAELNAEKIMNDAKNNSKNIKRITNEYVENLLKNTDKLLVNNINDFRNICQEIRSESYN